MNGKVRKYYVATPSGRRPLAQARRQIAELVAAVIEESDAPVLTGNKKGQANPPRSKEALWSI